jgi:hypothetical protein
MRPPLWESGILDRPLVLFSLWYVYVFLHITASQMTWPRPPPRTEDYSKPHPLSKMRHAPVPGMRASTSGLVFVRLDTATA